MVHGLVLQIRCRIKTGELGQFVDFLPHTDHMNEYHIIIVREEMIFTLSLSSLCVCVCVSNGKVFVINLIPNEDVNIEEVVSNRFLCLLFSVSSRLKPVYEAEKFRTICYKLKTSSFSSDSNSKMLLFYSHSVLLMCLHCVIINQKIVFYVSIELNV